MIATTRPAELPIEDVAVSAYRIPTDFPESDGTAQWNSTTLVIAEIRAGGEDGLGYTYADTATATVIRETLAPLLQGRDALEHGRRWSEMAGAIRNLGRPGICSMAISALDNALWDLRGKCFDLPIIALLGAARRRVPIYGSGGFTSYSIEQLRDQLAGWVADGIARVKMKVGRDPHCDLARVAAARDAIGPATELFVDANGAYSRKQALRFAEEFAEYDVAWFEEPVYHRDLEGLRQVRERVPARMEVSAGEYGYDPADFAALLDGDCVDVLQADATRCGGITGLLAVDGLCETKQMPLSTHCAPALHLHPAAAAKRLRHIEYFHDHARIERMLFDGVPTPVQGALKPDFSRPGLGLEFKRSDAQRYAV